MYAAHSHILEPRRNPDIDKIESQLEAIAQWCSSVSRYIMSELGSVRAVDAPSVDRQAINADMILCPALPLFEDRETNEPIAAGGEAAAELALVAKLEGSVNDGSPLMLPGDVNQLLDGGCSYGVQQW